MLVVGSRRDQTHFQSLVWPSLPKNAALNDNRFSHKLAPRLIRILTQAAMTVQCLTKTRPLTSSGRAERMVQTPLLLAHPSLLSSQFYKVGLNTVRSAGLFAKRNLIQTGFYYEQILNWLFLEIRFALNVDIKHGFMALNTWLYKKGCRYKLLIFSENNFFHRLSGFRSYTIGIK